MLFVYCRRDRANVGIISEDADEIRLLVLSYIGGNLTRILVEVFSVCVVLKQPSAVRILHRLFLLPNRRFGQLQRSSIGVNQPQFVGHARVMDNLVSSSCSTNVVTCLTDRQRACAVVALAETPFNSPRAEQSNMPPCRA